jgi:hypothetical protein
MKWRGMMWAVTVAGGLTGCASWSGKDEAMGDFEKAARAGDIRLSEDKARVGLRQLESALSDYLKSENKIPAKLEELVPKYIPAIPSLDLPVCAPESDHVEPYPATALRDGQVDGGKIRGTGHWGYVFNQFQVVVFIDCLRTSRSGVPWYQERGVY